jgi:hypothetical protein
MIQIKKLLAVTMALNLTGCATMITGTSRVIQFESTPPGATVTFQDKQCKTPCELTAELSGHVKQSMLKIDLDGHESYWTELTQSATKNDLAVGLALAGTLLIVPAIVDTGTGALEDWPKKVEVTLPEKGRGTALAQITR